MIITKCFPGDENETLKRVQASCYYNLLGNLYYFSASRYLEASDFLRIHTDLRKRILAKSRMDLRVLQKAHDQIAAYFRFTFDPSGQLPLPFTEISYHLYLEQNWVDYYTNVCRELAEDDRIAWEILHAVAYDQEEKGDLALKRLAVMLAERFPLPSFAHPSDLEADMILADRIRTYILTEYIEPARQRGEAVVRIRAGDVHAGLDLTDRMPAVCGALDAQKFLNFAGVRLVSRSGPPQGANAEWVFDLVD